VRARGKKLINLTTMVQWRSDNFEWKKIRFSLKTQGSYVVSKNAHNTRRTLFYSVVARSACDYAWLRLQLLRIIVAPLLHTRHTPPLRSKKNRLTHKPMDQPACGTDYENQPTFYMRNGPTRPVFTSLNGTNLCRTNGSAFPPL